jgi:uncharacterized phage-associated protein
MPAAVDSVFELAFWFADKALNENEYLQPLKMQQLLFLSQSYFAVATKGKKLIPAVFVAEDLGPVEPASFKAFTHGRPAIEVNMFLDPDVEDFIDGIWRRFGHHSAEHLAKLTQRNPAYREARRRAPRAEIPLVAMQKSFARAAETPSLEQVIRPKLMRSQSGKPVAVKAWVPPPAKTKP